MNERIKELALQAEQTFGGTFTFNGGEVSMVNLEKFAELIVRDCMEQVWYTREDGINGNVSEVIKDRITEHFGVAQ